MKHEDQTFSDLLHVLKKRARPAAIAAFAVLIAMTCFVFLLPAVYESKATLLIEHMDMPVELAGGAGSQEYVEQRLQRTKQRVLTDESVKTLVQKRDVYDFNDESDLEYLIEYFKENAFVTPQVTGVIDPRSMRSAELTYAFDVGFWHSDPEIATAVANDLADLFISSSAAQAREDALRAIEFAKVESERLAGELREREARLTTFRQQNPGGLPEDRVRNQDRALSLEREIAAIDADLRAARARRDLLEAQLRETPRDNPVITESGQVVMGGADRLAAAQTELAAALAKYSESHPDVRRLRREIATLSTEIQGGATSTPTNPAYIQLQSQVNAAGIEARELSARRSSVSSQLYQITGEITLSPKLEEQYRELVRDYEVMKTQYEQMRSQQATAELKAKAADTTAAESYVLINPARLPEDPVEPDRVALMFLAVVLAIAAGVGTAFLLNVADTTIRGSADVVAVSGSQPFAHVPTLRSSIELRKRRVTDLALAGGITMVAIIVLYIVN
jgi:polysaccharide chain length determinant protein (PEP-CTERM system associated)